MGIPGQHNVSVLVTTSDKCLLNFNKQLVEIVDGVASIEFQVRGDLVIATSTRVQLSTHITDPRDQRVLDMHVDVFEIRTEGELSSRNLFTDLVKMITDAISFEVCNQPGMSKHCGMGHGAANVDSVEPLIKADRLCEGFYSRIRRLMKSSAPCLGHVHSPVLNQFEPKVAYRVQRSLSCEYHREA